MSIIKFQNIELNIIENPQYEFLLSNKEVADGYGTTIALLSQAKSNHSEELIENKHFFRLEVMTNGGKQKVIHWTKRGIIRLGFFIKSEQAKIFRDFIEDLTVAVHDCVQRQNSNNDTTINIEVNPKDTKVRMAIYAAHEGKCFYSGQELKNDHFHIDHILPVSRGGQNRLDNLVPCEPSINLSKLANYDDNWVKEKMALASQKINIVLAFLNSCPNKLYDDNAPAHLFSTRLIEKFEKMFGVEATKEFYAQLLPGMKYQKSDTNSIDIFMNEKLVKNGIGYTPKDKVYLMYREWCEQMGISATSIQKFSRVMKHNFEETRVAIENTRTRCWKMEVLG
jgi:hypothetical protein